MWEEETYLPFQSEGGEDNFEYIIKQGSLSPCKSIQSLFRNRKEGSALLISGRGLLASSKQSVILRKSNCFHFSLEQGLGAKGFPEASLVLPPRDSKPCTGSCRRGYPASWADSCELCSSVSFCRGFGLGTSAFTRPIFIRDCKSLIQLMQKVFPAVNFLVSNSIWC